MDRDARQQRPVNGPEKDMLEAFLDFHRDTLLWKVPGLGEDELRRTWVPSGVTLLGLVKHLAYVERWWFQAVFAGRDVWIPWREDARGEDWRLEPEETVQDVLDFYQVEVQRSREISAAASPDDQARMPGREHNLRRILLHMIEETARHNGHADILRELTDGATGE